MKKPVTAEQVEHAVREFITEREIAVGTATQRSRFYEFKVNAEIREMAKTALEQFKDGAFEEALAGINEAKKRLIWSQRRYCAGSVEHRFMRMILDLPHLDEDAQSRLLKQKDAFAKVAEQIGKGGGDLEKASQMFWDLRDSIRRAPEDQSEREREREELKRKGKLKARQQRLDAEVQASRERNRLARQQEAEKRAELVNQLEAVL